MPSAPFRSLLLALRFKIKNEGNQGIQGGTFTSTNALKNELQVLKIEYIHVLPLRELLLWN